MQNEIDLNAFQTCNNVIEVLQENQEDYNELRNKPLINDVELKGNKSTADLGLATAEQGEKADTAVQPSDLSDYVTTTELNTGLATKQDELVSGTNIKSINNTSLLGEGNLSITAETSWGYITGTLSNQTDLKGALDAKANTSDLGTMASENASDYTKTSSLATVATTGDYDDLIDKPSLGTMAAESASDYTKTAGLATVATTGSYSDLSNKPTIPEGLPSQTSQSGKFLTTNGTTASWDDIPTELPSQTGNSGKFLTTDGTSASWATVQGGGGAENVYTQDNLVAGEGISIVPVKSYTKVVCNSNNSVITLTASPSVLQTADNWEYITRIKYHSPTMGQFADFQPFFGGSSGTHACPFVVIPGNLLGIQAKNTSGSLFLDLAVPISGWEENKEYDLKVGFSGTYYYAAVKKANSTEWTQQNYTSTDKCLFSGSLTLLHTYDVNAAPSCDTYLSYTKITYNNGIVFFNGETAVPGIDFLSSNVVTTEVSSEVKQINCTVSSLTSYTGYDATKTQVLKNVNGTLTWVDEA